MTQRSWLAYIVGAATVALLWILSPPHHIVGRETAQPFAQHAPLDHECLVAGTVTNSGHAISFDRIVCAGRDGQITDTQLARAS